ncbi:ParB family chromosome partitioning protein [Pseudomonas duriflava]|uniref:ParB family chromosome partitioning protein n=1 Tax=Pseudomonas duriflava TaxID=459528 RepID=A0A562PKE4_9PSED|nr:ParB/RepB/Spo0J family partition protein [Pseudomonas duriflava]TWI44680.1 ParB family chromosome partitioning protein [Pseudomonas duriflava]
MTNGMDLDDLSSLLHAPVAKSANQGPILIPQDLIDPDPDQPRKPGNPGFSKESLKELAESISAINESGRPRGVKSPISVRENPNIPGRYLINHGERRWRANGLAGNKEIPAFIDNDYTHSDQVIENLQRNELTAREIADYIAREMNAGLKKNEISKRLGKSAAWVSQHAALLDLPDPIAEAFAKGRVNDVTVINELVKAFKESPEDVVDLLEDDTQDVTRSTVKTLREYIDSKKGGDEDAGYDSRDPDTIDVFDKQTDREKFGEDEDGEEEEVASKPKKPTENDPTKFKKAVIQVSYGEDKARLMMDKRPSQEGNGWIKFLESGKEIEVPLCDVVLLQLIEG